MIHLYFLHGFLGLPSDWKFLSDSFPNYNLHFPQLFSEFNPINGFQHFSAQLNRSVDPNATNILIGYSLGGRLALHALLDQPNLWSQAAFISTHPGLQTEEEKKQRVIKDAIWANRFLKDDWSQLMHRWNEQPVFADTARMERREEEFSRRDVADALQYWSLGRQQDLRKQLADMHMPIYWIVGKNDRIFLELSDTIQLKHPSSQIKRIEQAGHRVLWDCQEVFIKCLKQLILDR